MVQDYFKDISATLFKFKEMDFLCDTVLITDDKVLKAHGVLLAAASTAFRVAYESDNNPGLHCIKLPGYSSATIEIALHFMYTGKLLLPPIYAKVNELSKLLTSLNELGLDLQQLNGCEITFKQW